MKKILFTVVSALTIGAAVAADSTQFGVLKVPSSAKETIVAVPWIASSTAANDPVKVADLVLTAGLEAEHDSYLGDELRYYTGTGAGYYVWRLVADDKGVKSWVGGNMVNDGDVSEVPDAQGQTVARGQAIILKRANPAASGFCIMGKPTTTAAAATPLAAGGAYTLIAPPTVANGGTSINGGLTWVGMENAKEYLYVPTAAGGMSIYRYVKVGDAEGCWKKTTDASTDGVIPTGMGAWFRSAGTGTKSVQLTAHAQ